MPDMRVVKCNYLEPTKIASAGSVAYLSLTNPGGGNDRIVVLVRSRSGRLVRKWESIKRLGNFRAKTIPPEHPRYGDERLWTYNPEETAITMALSKFTAKGSIDG
jgi:hypothetical protein